VHLLRLTAFATLLALMPLTASADLRDLQRAKAAYRSRDYAQARDLLMGLFERRELTVRAERINARTFLAACHYALGEIDLARAQLRELFAEEPGAPIDPKVFGPIRPTFVELAEEIRTDIAKEHGDRPVRAAPASESGTLELTEERPHGPPSLAFAFVPFGVGQFANDQSTKGGFFLLVEGAAFLTAGVSLALMESKKQTGHFLVDGQYATLQDLQTAYTLQTTYLITFWGGVAVAIGGVIDAVLNRPSASAFVAVGPGGVVARW